MGAFWGVEPLAAQRKTPVSVPSVLLFCVPRWDRESLTVSAVNEKTAGQGFASSRGFMVTGGMFGAPTRVRTTVEAEVIRKDGKRERLGVIADSSRQLRWLERLRRMVRANGRPR